MTIIIKLSYIINGSLLFKAEVEKNVSHRRIGMEQTVAKRHI